MTCGVMPASRHPLVHRAQQIGTARQYRRAVARIACAGHQIALSSRFRRPTGWRATTGARTSSPRISSAPAPAAADRSRSDACARGSARCVASTSENSSLRKYGLTLNTSALCSIVSRSTFVQSRLVLVDRSRVDLLRQPVPVALDAVQRQAKLRAQDRIDRHQRRMRKALIQILDDDARVVQHQVAIDQRRQAVVRIAGRAGPPDSARARH